MDNFEKLYRAANENIVLSPDFSDRTMDAIFGGGKVRRFNVKKALILAAAAVLLLALGACTAVAVQYITNKTPFSHSEHYSANSDKYTEKVNIPCENNGLTVVLTEAVYESEKLRMIFDFELEGHDNVEGLAFFSSDVLVKIDGLPFLCEPTGQCLHDGFKSWVEMEVDLNRANLIGKHEFEVSIDGFDVIFDPYELVEYDGVWTYTFSLNTSALNRDTVIFDIDKTITLHNGDKVYVDKIICTPMSQRLIFTVPTTGDCDYAEYYVYAEDRKGVCQFNFDNMVAGYGESINDNPDYFDMDAQSISLRIYVRDGWGEELAKPIDVVCNRLV